MATVCAAAQCVGFSADFLQIRHSLHHVRCREDEEGGNVAACASNHIELGGIEDPPLTHRSLLPGVCVLYTPLLSLLRFLFFKLRALYPLTFQDLSPSSSPRLPRFLSLVKTE